MIASLHLNGTDLSCQGMVKLFGLIPRPAAEDDVQGLCS